MNPAQTIAERYELQGRLGVGGMSTVQLAFDHRLERHVAVKLLAEHLAEDENFVSRFRREALAAARLVHPNIVQVFDFGLDEDSHRHFIVMEYVPGNSCAELLRDHGRLDPQDAVDIISQACRGLDHAHRNGVVHRDVKPGNLMRTPEGTVKLADFGIAKATEQTGITQAGSVLGTAAYLAPEQARGEPAGPPSDIYALGVVSYQLMSGRLPYEATSLTELALKQQNEPPVPLDRGQPRGSAGARARGGARAVARPGHALRRRAADGRGAAGRGARRRAAAGAHRHRPAHRCDAVPRRRAGHRRDAGARRRLRRARRDRRDPDAAPAAASAARSSRGRRASAAPAPAPVAPKKKPVKKKRRGLRRAMGLLLLILILAAAGIAAILYADSQSQNPRLRDNFGQSVDQAIQDIKSLIDDNTQ